MKKRVYKWWHRVPCFFGVHLYGHKNLGMFGDAASCSVCGADRYGLFVINEEEE